MNIALAEVVAILGGRWSGPARPEGRARGAAIDSRLVSEGDLFFAMTGSLQDGHDFVEDARTRGAIACVVSRPVGGPPSITVRDVPVALRELAGFNRDLVDPIVIGVTGSMGKTSTKDLIAAVCSSKFSTVASPGSYNNETGVPLTLMKASPGTEVLVSELGARGPGHIRDLCTFVRPQMGVVTNVGPVHLEHFESVKKVARAKRELVESLPEGGSAVLNADDPEVSAMATATAAQVITFGLGSADIRGQHIRLDAIGRPTFRIARGGDGVWVTLSASGRHQVYNALAAAAAGTALGLSLEDLRVGLESAGVSPLRMETRQVNGIILLNDAYNSNPKSVRAAFDTATEIVPEGGRLIAVLGHMAELGSSSDSEHDALGRLAAGSCDRLIIVGQPAARIADAAAAAGLREILRADDADEAVEALAGSLREKDVVLVKGSRVASMEGIVPRLEATLT